jgi:hypothetical protein
MLTPGTILSLTIQPNSVMAAALNKWQSKKTQQKVLNINLERWGNPILRKRFLDALEDEIKSCSKRTIKLNERTGGSKQRW